MQPEDKGLAVLWDILQAARLAVQFIGDATEAQFAEIPKTQAAVIRQFEIIGEAAKRLSVPFREQHPAVPWKEMAGMRDVIIHQYDQVNLVRVWEAATRELPRLIAYLESLLPPDPE